MNIILRFFGICVLVCTFMISLGSCQKDYSEDIDDLQEQINDIKGDIAALNQAIAQGKIIISVSNVTGGYEITFSDNSSIVIEHGQDGADGADGEDGATGADGFTPIIGIDADGYWTVITTEGGTPVRIQDVNGNDVKAEPDDEFGVTANGMLTIGGVETAVQIPVIIYNEETETLQITIKNEEGDFVTYNIPIAENAFGVADLTSVVSPIGNTNVYIRYGIVPAKDYYDYLAPGFGDELFETFGLVEGQILASPAVLPVLLNPSGIKLDDYSFKIINNKNEEFYLQPDSISKGYDGSFSQFANPFDFWGSNLYSLHFSPEDDIKGDEDEITNDLAVKVSKGEDELISGFQYSIKVGRADSLAYVPDTINQLYLNPDLLLFSEVGDQLDILSYFFTPDLSGRMIEEDDFYELRLIGFINDFVSIDGTVISSDNSVNAKKNLESKIIHTGLFTVDYSASVNFIRIGILFWVKLQGNFSVFDPVVHVVDGIERSDTISLVPLSDELHETGLINAFALNATDIRFIIIDPDGNEFLPVEDISSPSGIDYFFIDDSGNQLTLINDTIPSYFMGFPVKAVFTFDETIVSPGNYKARMIFEDKRLQSGSIFNIPEYDEFTVDIPFNLINPEFGTGSMAEHRTNVFFGEDSLIVYGYSPINNVAQRSSSTTYPLYNAYKYLEDSVAVWDWFFESDEALLSDDISSGDLYNITPQSMYSWQPVKLYTNLFGNPNNKVLLETIYVSSHSEVKDGELILKNSLPELIYGNTSSSNLINLSDYYKVVDYLGNDLLIFEPIGTGFPAPPLSQHIVPNTSFGMRDVRADNVSLVVDPDFAHLVELYQTSFDWVVKAKSNVNVFPADYVDVPLKLTITDLYDVETVYTIIVRVVKP